MREIRGIIATGAVMLALLAGCAAPAAPSPTVAPAKPTTPAGAPTAAPAVATAVPTARAAGAPTVAPAAGTAAPATGAPLLIAAIAPTSGGNAAFGNPFVRGVEMAVEDINAKGGVNIGGQKTPLKVIVYDDKYTAEGGTAAGQKAVYEDKVKFIIGSLSSPSVLAWQPITEKEKVLTFAATVSPLTTTPEKPYTFKGGLSAREITADFYKLIKKQFPDLKTMGLIEPNDEAGRSDGERIVGEAKAAGIEVVTTEYFTRGTADYYPTLTKVIAKNPDAIDTGVTVPSGVPVKQIRELGYKGRVWGAGVDSASFLATAGTAAEGFLGYFMPPDYYGPDGNPTQKALAERYKTKYGEPVTSPYWELTYNMTNGLAKAIETAGTADTTKVAETFRKDGFQWDTMIPEVKAKMVGEKTYGIRSIVSTAFYLTEISGGKVKLLATGVDMVP